MAWYALSYYWQLSNTFWYFSLLVILRCCFNNLTAGRERFEWMLWAEECNSCGYVSPYSSYWVCLLIGAALIFLVLTGKPTCRFSSALSCPNIYHDNNVILHAFYWQCVLCCRNCSCFLKRGRLIRCWQHDCHGEILDLILFHYWVHFPWNEELPYLVFGLAV
jgi:hypothetical protein